MKLSPKIIRVGVIGLGRNCRLRHVPGLRACAGVEIFGVCNRNYESSEAVSRQLNISRVYSEWTQLVDDSDIDAVVIGTWPYLHCPATIRALEAGKHVLTEARMAMNLAEARLMNEVRKRNPHLVAQIVPSPLGLRAHRFVKELIDEGFLGDLREVVVLSTNSTFTNPETPIHWRKRAVFSGINLLDLGILHETLGRWLPEPSRVYAHTQVFTQVRMEPATGLPAPVENADSAQIVCQLPNGALVLYHLSDSIHFGPSEQIHLYGSQGTIKYLLKPEDKLFVGAAGEDGLHELAIPAEKEETWRVEEEFVGAIRGEEIVRFTDFDAGVRYMEFTEAVVQSSTAGTPVTLPLP